MAGFSGCSLLGSGGYGNGSSGPRDRWTLVPSLGILRLFATGVTPNFACDPRGLGLVLGACCWAGLGPQDSKMSLMQVYWTLAQVGRQSFFSWVAAGLEPRPQTAGSLLAELALLLGGCLSCTESQTSSLAHAFLLGVP